MNSSLNPCSHSSIHHNLQPIHNLHAFSSLTFKHIWHFAAKSRTLATLRGPVSWVQNCRGCCLLTGRSRMCDPEAASRAVKKPERARISMVVDSILEQKYYHGTNILNMHCFLRPDFTRKWKLAGKIRLPTACSGANIHAPCKIQTSTNLRVFMALFENLSAFE